MKVLASWRLGGVAADVAVARVLAGLGGRGACAVGRANLPSPQGGGCALMNRSAKFQQIVRGMSQVRDGWPCPGPSPAPPRPRQLPPVPRCWTCR